MDWSCKKLPRVARSSLSAEAQAATIAEGELTILRLANEELTKGGVDLQNFDHALQAGVPDTMITDCKALYDAECKVETAGLGVADRRCSIEILGLRQNIRNSGTTVRWVHSHAQLADGLTKSSLHAYRLLLSFLCKQKQRWRLLWDEQFLSARKRAVIGKDIFDPVNWDDRQIADEVINHRRALRQRAAEIRSQQNNSEEQACT